MQLFLYPVACLVLSSLVLPISAYFVVKSPKLHDQWVDGEIHKAAWVKGLDGINNFDIILSRLSTTSLIPIAKNVPSADKSQTSMNILLQDVPPADDYFMFFCNSTNGAQYATSQRFSVLSAGSSGNMSSATNPKAATVTVSGAPNPTQAFAMTFALASSGSSRLTPGQTWGVLTVGCVLGAMSKFL